ncbi:MAG: riboflavin synthase [Candidatus Magasanikbacteria bacterium]|nr:riboflavin synthase [Candidatus Magasanikbacteria bacterium]
MFTGIISATSKITKKEFKNDSLFLTIKKPTGWKIKCGDSIATNGACLTVKKILKDAYLTELMPETRDKTYFEKMNLEFVNLERSLKLSDRLGGHFVTGHVDAMGKIIDLKKRGKSLVFKISFPKKFAKYVAEKGSITIDGISLTVVDVGVNWFTVSLVEYTLIHTTLGMKKKTDLVHLEFDILAKYIEKQLKN